MHLLIVMLGFQVMSMRISKMQELHERRVTDNAGITASYVNFGCTASTSMSSGNSVGSGHLSGQLREQLDKTQMPLHVISLNPLKFIH
jgi:hypothetical protein